MTRLSRVLARTPPQSPLSLRLCQAFSEILGSEGGAITVGFSPPERVTLCTTDDASARVEDAQDVSREGPSLDAHRTGLPVTLLSRAEQQLRWPMLTQMLDQDLVHWVLHAFPMRPESTVLGVVSVYQTHDRGPAVSTEEAQFLANTIGVALLGNLDPASVSDERWAVRDKIDQATGMVIARLRIPRATQWPSCEPMPSRTP